MNLPSIRVLPAFESFECSRPLNVPITPSFTFSLVQDPHGPTRVVAHARHNVLGIEKIFFVDQIDVHGSSTTFESGSWKLTKGSRLASGNKERVFVMLARTLTENFLIVAKDK